MFKRLLRTLIAILLIAVLIVASGCGTRDNPPPKKSAQPDQVVFSLNWLPSESVACWAALDKGFWAEQNLDVKIVRGYGSGDTVAKIAMKKAEFGIADIGSLILARAKEDVKVKAVANYETFFTAAILYSKTSGISKPKDLEGKAIVSSANSAYKLFFPAFAKATGIDESKISWKLVDPSLQQTVFLRGEADAWTSDIERLVELKKLTGEDVPFFSYKKDANIDRYGESILVHEDTIAQNPDLVRRFVAGYLKGVAYCLENPSEVGYIMKKYVPEVDAGLTSDSWRVDVDQNTFNSDESREKGLGWMSRDKMAKTVGYVLNAYNIKKEIPIETVYTTQFLPDKPIYPPSN